MGERLRSEKADAQGSGMHREAECTGGMVSDTVESPHAQWQSVDKCDREFSNFLSCDRFFS